MKILNHYLFGATGHNSLRMAHVRRVSPLRGSAAQHEHSREMVARRSCSLTPSPVSESLHADDNVSLAVAPSFGYACCPMPTRHLPSPASQ